MEADAERLIELQAVHGRFEKVRRLEKALRLIPKVGVAAVYAPRVPSVTHVCFLMQARIDGSKMTLTN